MRPPVPSLLLASLAVLLVAPAAEAQKEDRPGIVEVSGPAGGRGGFWIGFGAGAGIERVNLDGDGRGYSDELTQPTLSLRLGGTVSRNLRLGGEVLTWLNEEGDVLESLTSVNLIAQFYPARDAGFYLKGGAGFARSAIDSRDGFGGVEVADNGFATQVGAGWEIPVARGLYIVPAVDLVQHWYDGGRDPGYRERIAAFTIGVTWQTGR